jgi:hypothetical protein
MEKFFDEIRGGIVSFAQGLIFVFEGLKPRIFGRSVTLTSPSWLVNERF